MSFGFDVHSERRVQKAILRYRNDRLWRDRSVRRAGLVSTCDDRGGSAYRAHPNDAGVCGGRGRKNAYQYKQGLDNFVYLPCLS